MKTKIWIMTVAVLATQVIHAATIRVGEQDSCKVMGVTTIADKSVSFDLSGVKAAGEVKEARLRIWIRLGGQQFDMDNWNNPDFDGFKVTDASGLLLDTVYPFASSIALHEWDVTTAVKGKLGSGKVELKTNFKLPGNDFKPAWQRAYLQITTIGKSRDTPVSPSDMKAKYRHGQVFLTWKQIPFDGPFFDSTYRIYKYSDPITAANLDKAELLGEVNMNSQLNYRRTAYTYGALASYGPYRHLWFYVQHYLKQGWPKNVVTKNDQIRHLWTKLPKRYNFVIDDEWPKTIEDGKWLTDAKVLGDGLRILEGPMLSDDTGLFVYTVKKEEKAYFAVTSITWGNENRSDLGSGNALGKAVELKVAPPKPVLQVLFHGQGRKLHEQLRQYTFWGGPDEGLHNEPSTPFMMQINTPMEYVGYQDAWWARKNRWIQAGAIYYPMHPIVGHDRSYIPPTRLTPFPSLSCAMNYSGWPHHMDYYRGSQSADGFVYKKPDDKKEWWPSQISVGDFSFPSPLGVRKAPANDYGYHNHMNTGKDPRKAMAMAYFETRIAHTIRLFLREFPQADPNRVVYHGKEAAFLMGIHNPDLFGAVSSNQHSPWSAKRNENQWPFIGRREWNLKNEKGISIWNWNDPIWFAKQFPKLAWPYISNCQSPNYDHADNISNWKSMGFPEFYLDLAKLKRGGHMWWVDIGDAPNVKPTPVAKNMAYPTFTSVNFCEVPREIWRKEPRGGMSGYIDFLPNANYLKLIRRDTALAATLTAAWRQIDTTERFEMPLRIGDLGLSLNGAEVPPTTAKFGKTDITLWRLQQFTVEAGKKYRWTNKKVVTGQVLQTGIITPDENNLLTVPGFMIDRDPGMNKLILTPDTGDAPAIDEAMSLKIRVEDQEIELAYADYVKQCTNPVLFPMVKLPSTTMKISEFTQAGKCNPDGTRSFRDTSWGLGLVKTIVKLPKAGDYLMTVRAKGKKAEAGNWPSVEAHIGRGLKINRFQPQIIAGTEYQDYHWYVNLDEGKNEIQLGVPSDYYAAATLPGVMKGRTMKFEHFTINYITEADAEKPNEIRVSPRGIAMVAGMPTRMTAQVLNKLGKPMDEKVTWTCEGGEISADGILKAMAPGTCKVTASAAGLKTTVSVEVADSFVEHFNEGGGTLRNCWTPADLEKEKGNWNTPTGGHHMLTSLWQDYRKQAKSMLLLSSGTEWVNYEFAADMVLIEKFHRPDGVRGLVVSAKDKDNHIRLELRHKGTETAAVIVKRKAGEESVLAENKTAPGYQPFNWKTNPMCPGWHSKEGMKLGGWNIDQMRVQVKDGELRAWVADTELFPDGVKDADIGAGTIGLYSENACSFDNVVVKAGK